MNTEEDVVDAHLNDAWDAGCTCVPRIWVNDVGPGLALLVRLEHEPDCPLQGLAP